MHGNEADSCGSWWLNGTTLLRVRDIKRQRIGVRCLGDLSVLFRRWRAGIEAQVFGDLWLIWSRRENLVAFPAAERQRANSQSVSSFRLEDPQLEAAASQVAADGGRDFWDWYSTIVGW